MSLSPGQGVRREERARVGGSSLRKASQNASVAALTSLKIATSRSADAAFLPAAFGDAAPGSAERPVNVRWLAPSMNTANFPPGGDSW